MFGGKAVLCKSEATLGSGWLRTDCARRAGNLLHGKLGQRLTMGGISKLRSLCQDISNNYKYVLNLLALCLILRKNKEFAAL